MNAARAWFRAADAALTAIYAVQRRTARWKAGACSVDRPNWTRPLDARRSQAPADDGWQDERLQQIKAAVDPDNRFRPAQGIR